jgi:FixJ family two-component response regulator
MPQDTSRDIIFLDDDADLRDTMREIFDLGVGEHCHSFASLSELKSRPDTVLNSKLAILDINLGANQPNGLDAYNWLQENRFRGRVVFLTGHAHSNPLVNLIIKLNKAVVLEKPVALEKLIELVEPNRAKQH